MQVVHLHKRMHPSAYEKYIHQWVQFFHPSWVYYINMTFIPFQRVECPMIVPAEYRAVSSLKVPEELEQSQHPTSGNSRRFVLGDRFHSATNPPQITSACFRTSTCVPKEMLSKLATKNLKIFRKNMRGLRSSTLQGFGIHFCSNYLMDFYQNEAIVKQQQITKISKHLKEGQQVVRDRYHRLCVIAVVNSVSYK